MPEEFLVVSHKHGLLPVANRLLSAGEETQTIVWKHRFEKAWQGKITPALRGSKGEVRQDTMQLVTESVNSGQTILVTDMSELEGFDSAPLRYHRVRSPEEPISSVRLGGWFDGEKFQQVHLLLVDRGAWPGGLGAGVDAGLTMVLPDPDWFPRDLLDELWQGLAEKLKSAGFRGLVQADVNQSPETGGPELGGWLAGWPWLHTQAFLSELENLPELLKGDIPEYPKDTRYTVVLPVSIPPWPYVKSAGAEVYPVEGLTNQDMSRFFWHDIQVDSEHRELKSGGLDGLLGVSRGSGWSFELARQQALGQAFRLSVPEKQFRPDIGVWVPEALGTLERNFGLRLG
jgi:hypothetical protein